MGIDTPDFSSSGLSSRDPNKRGQFGPDELRAAGIQISSEPSPESTRRREDYLAEAERLKALAQEQKEKRQEDLQEKRYSKSVGVQVVDCLRSGDLLLASNLLFVYLSRHDFSDINAVRENLKKINNSDNAIQGLDIKNLLKSTESVVETSAKIAGIEQNIEVTLSVTDFKNGSIIQVMDVALKKEAIVPVKRLENTSQRIAEAKPATKSGLFARIKRYLSDI